MEPEPNQIQTAKPNSQLSPSLSSKYPLLQNLKTIGFKRVFSIETQNLEESTINTSKLSLTLNSKSQENSFDQGILSPEKLEKDERNFSPYFKKIQLTPSIISKIEKGSLSCRSNFSKDLLLKCVLTYEGKLVETNCRLIADELQFENTGCSFKVSKLTKMKVVYEDYKKCIWFTYDDFRSNRSVETKFKVFIHKDIKDDLYFLFSKVLVQKLILLQCPVNLLQADENVDRFRMEGSVLKRSQFLGKWAERKIVVTDKIESFKGEKRTFEMKNIREIWTRFDMQEGNIVLKIRHGSDKTELALPVVNFTARFCKQNWIYRIYRLVSATLL